MVARWCQSWVECAFKAGRRWEGGTIHVCSFAVMADAVSEAITSHHKVPRPKGVTWACCLGRDWEDKKLDCYD